MGSVSGLGYAQMHYNNASNYGPSCVGILAGNNNWRAPDR